MIENKFGTAPDKKCYMRFEGDAACAREDLVGGHMMENESSEPAKGAIVYIIPICKGHNIHTNTKEMKITSGVK